MQRLLKMSWNKWKKFFLFTTQYWVLKDSLDKKAFENIEGKHIAVVFFRHIEAAVLNTSILTLSQKSPGF